MAEGFVKVRAADGAARRVMWDGTWYELPEGETRIFPEHIAQHFAKNHNLPNADGVYQESLVLQRVSDENLLVRGMEAREMLHPCGFPGCEFESADAEVMRAHFRAEHFDFLEASEKVARKQKAKDVAG